MQSAKIAWCVALVVAQFLVLVAEGSPRGRRDRAPGTDTVHVPSACRSGDASDVFAQKSESPKKYLQNLISQNVGTTVLCYSKNKKIKFA